MNEPVAVVNLVLGVIRSGLAFAVGMDWFVMTPQQMDQALVFAAALSLLIDFLATWWIRSRVTPIAKLPAMVQKAVEQGRHDETTVRR